MWRPRRRVRTCGDPEADTVDGIMRAMIKRPLRRSAGALVFAVLAATAFAADKTKDAAAKEPAKETRAFGKPDKGSGLLLTRAQLRDCMALQDRRQADAAESAKQRAEMEREKAELLRDGDALKEQLAALDRTSQEAVDQYNERAGARDRRIDAFEVRTTDFNKRVEALQALNGQFAANCDNRRYDEADEAAIRKESRK